MATHSPRMERAIAERLDFAFEPTLGGNTIPQLLEGALDAWIACRVWFVGLNTPELHAARVRARVAAGAPTWSKAIVMAALRLA